ncbi:hypothetical protein COV19_04485 [Candidatus Woesearchaeota archaeon CG10_big_fil_rev_8_21_14_0_10_44_13]|nr:MAG: hypothetical protein COV19_04485 [Candidatus Woesearchaeota archaeon CG10_big_fil_rev_8_21_14_0_10_44_13]
MIIAIVALLMIALFLVIGRMSMGDAAIFLYSDKCSVCKNVEPEIRDTIAKSGLKFYKARYDEPGFTPGLILMHNDTVLITGYRDVQSLRQQICGFTKIGKACRLAGEVWG